LRSLPGKTGLKEKLKKTADFEIPDEFQKKLDEIPALEAAFRALTRDVKDNTSFTFLSRNNPRLGNQELKNACSKFSWERD